ncbi:hypothetical protein H0H93_007525 [Arthromyces matolae]|nr:hypothetical protein H0H93_007525 [Arthromyces matolae]
MASTASPRAMLSPRPILKRSAQSLPHTQHAVHFPPSPSLTTHTFVAYSATAYDRSPIQVSPNSCALPERGCPGRTYTLDDPAGRGLHPRALAKQRLDHIPPPPPLIPDLSSESDDSDNALHSPPDVLGLVFHDMTISPTALAFLPHPPSPPSPHHKHNDDDDSCIPKPRRRKLERKHDASRVPDRIPDAPSLCPTIRPPTKKRVSRGLSPCHSSFRVDDDGCLGGF